MFCHGDHWDPGPNWDWTRFMDYVARGGCACVPDAPEMCNGFDDDCDGVVDEDAGCPVCAPIPAGGRVVEEDGADAPCFEVGGPREYWRDVTGAGSAGHLFWTHTTDDAVVANYGVWRLELEAEGDYLVCAYTDPAYAQSHRAVYQVEHAGARDDVPVDQAAVGGWSEIGRFHFAAGGGQSVRVDDNTGEALATNTQLVADALKVLPAGATDCNADPGVAIESDGGPGSASDGGTTPRDGAVATDGRASGDAGPDMTLSSGCGCVAAGGSDRGRFGWPLVVGAVALALALRARRRR